MTKSELDPKGLLHESFNIDGINAEQCRSIFLDWALSLPEGVDSKEALGQLLQQFESDQADHPMIQVMQAGLADMGRPKRRGGWRSRPR